MAAATLLKYAYLTCFSKPKAERTLYRLIREHQPARILELGMGSGTRALRMIAVAQRYAPLRRISYVGIDLFEGRPAGQSGLSLKQAYRSLHATGVGVRLLPGDPLATLGSTANMLPGIDLMVIAADQQGPSLERAWFYVPRMLHEDSIVVCEGPGTGDQAAYELLDRAELARLAAPPRRQAA